MRRFLATYWLAILVFLATLRVLWDDSLTFWSALAWITLVVQAMLLGLAVQLYRSKRTPGFAWLVWALVTQVFAQSSWFLLSFFSGLMGPGPESDASAAIFRLSERVEIAFELVSFLLFALALRWFLAEPRAGEARASNEAIEPTTERDAEEKVIRFGCGFLIGAALAFVGGLGVALGDARTWIILIVICALGFGILATVFGDGFWQRLMNVLRWWQ